MTPPAPAHRRRLLPWLAAGFGVAVWAFVLWFVVVVGGAVWRTEMDAEEIASLVEQFRRDIADGRFDQAYRQMHPSFRARSDADALKGLIEHSPIRRHLGCALGDPESVGDRFLVRDQAHHDVYIVVSHVNGDWYVNDVAAEGTGFL